jgi:hypothetical protein
VQRANWGFGSTGVIGLGTRRVFGGNLSRHAILDITSMDELEGFDVLELKIHPVSKKHCPSLRSFHTKRPYEKVSQLGSRSDVMTASLRRISGALYKPDPG